MNRTKFGRAVRVVAAVATLLGGNSVGHAYSIAVTSPTSGKYTTLASITVNGTYDYS